MNMPDVADVQINFEDKTATVTSKPGKAISREQFEAALKSAGYGVTAFTAAGQPPAAGT